MFYFNVIEYSDWNTLTFNMYIHFNENINVLEKCLNFIPDLNSYNDRLIYVVKYLWKKSILCEYLYTQSGLSIALFDLLLF